MCVCVCVCVYECMYVCKHSSCQQSANLQVASCGLAIKFFLYGSVQLTVSLTMGHSKGRQYDLKICKLCCA